MELGAEGAVLALHVLGLRVAAAGCRACSTWAGRRPLPACWRVTLAPVFRNYIRGPLHVILLRMLPCLAGMITWHWCPLSRGLAAW